MSTPFNRGRRATAAAEPTQPTAPGATRPGKPSLAKRMFGPHPLGALFSAPYAIYLIMVFAVPLIMGIWIAFHKYSFVAPWFNAPNPFVGFQNFVTAFTDPEVLRSFVNVGIFLVINVPLTVGLSLLLANALNQGIRGIPFFRTSFYLPYVIASVATVTVWMFLFSSDGLVNTVLGSLAPDPSWLVNKAWAMPMIALYVTWKQLGFFIMLYLAALQNVPKELYEAAKTDGATWWQSFRAVTWPGVRPATALVTMFAIITGMNLFTEPYLLTGGGGPDGASTTPVLLIYQKALEQNHPDVASAIGIVLVILTLGLTLLSRRLTEGKD